MSGKVIIGAELQLQSAQALESVGKVKQALRESQKALSAAQQEFGEFSQQAINAAKQVAHLKDRLGDAANLVDAFNPDQKFKAFANSLNGVVGGFTAVQGVMGLVGVESQEVEKALLKVQSAMALSQGLNAVLDSVQSFKSLGIVIKNSNFYLRANDILNKASAASMRLFGVSVATTSTSFKVLKGAILATGIGALLILVGEAVSYFDQLSSAAENAAEKEREALELRTKGAAAGLSGREQWIEREGKLEVARAKNANKSEREIFEIEQKYRRLRAGAVVDYINEVGTATEAGQEAQKRLNDLNTEGQIAALDFETGVNQKRLDQQKQFNEKRAAESKQAAEKARQQRDADQKAAESLNAELGIENKTNAISGETERKLFQLQLEYDQKKIILEKGEQDLTELTKWFNQQRSAILIESANERDAKAKADHDAALQRERERLEFERNRMTEQVGAHKEAAAWIAANEQMSFEERRALIEAGEQTLADTTNISEEQRTSMAKNYSDARKLISELEYEHKMNTLNLTTSALDAFGEIAGRQTTIGKGLAIASTLISTYSAAQKAYESQMQLTPDSPIRAAIAAAVAVAGGLAKVKAIVGVKVPKGGGASGSIPSGLSGGGAPLSPGIGNNVTRLDRDTINQMGNQAVKTFVIESDVTGNQERIRRINRAARIG
jgi:hypothetical protein